MRSPFLTASSPVFGKRVQLKLISVPWQESVQLPFHCSRPVAAWLKGSVIVKSRFKRLPREPETSEADFRALRSRFTGALTRIIQCAVQRRRSTVGATPTRQLSLRPVAIGAAVEVTKLPKPSMEKVASGDLASRQAVT
jgi:hypothetical protein